MTDLFAAYDPSPRKAQPLSSADGLVIRHACDADAGALGRISAEREGGNAHDHAARFEKLLAEIRSAENGAVFVAELPEGIIGYGRVAHFMPAPESPANAAPAGWYLMGVIVVHAYRRRGIGALLTEERLRWIAERSATAYYFANVRNAASIELHRRCGFVELTRDFSIPGAAFTGGVGILFGVGLGERVT